MNFHRTALLSILALSFFSLLAVSRAPDATADRITLGQATDASCSKRTRLKSLNSDRKGTITFINRSGSERAIMWLDFEGHPKEYAALKDGEKTVLQTYVTHPWMVTDGPGNCLTIYMPGPDQSVVEIDPLTDSPPEKRSDDDSAPAKKRSSAAAKVKGCEEGYALVNGKCKRRKASNPGSCPPGTVPVPQTDNCIKPTEKTDSAAKPWTKPGCKTWQKQCAAGNNAACGKYESTCQVN